MVRPRMPRPPSPRPRRWPPAVRRPATRGRAAAPGPEATPGRASLVLPRAGAGDLDGRFHGVGPPTSPIRDEVGADDREQYGRMASRRHALNRMRGAMGWPDPEVSESCGTTLRSSLGRLEIATAGGAGRR